MRVVIQRVSEAKVMVGKETTGTIGPGLLILLGIEEQDERDDAVWLSGKIAKMRIFSDDTGAMNRSLIDIGGRALVVSQFTLHASTKKGNRPSFIKAARPEKATVLYEEFCELLGLELGQPVASGRFGAEMKVSLLNDGPVTIVMDSRNRE